MYHFIFELVESQTEKATWAIEKSIQDSGLDLTSFFFNRW